MSVVEIVRIAAAGSCESGVHVRRERIADGRARVSYEGSDGGGVESIDIPAVVRHRTLDHINRDGGQVIESCPRTGVDRVIRMAGEHFSADADVDSITEAAVIFLDSCTVRFVSD